MKKRFLSIYILCILHSFLFVHRTFAQYADIHPLSNTEQKRPDAANGNIAGTAFLTDGLYVQSGNAMRFVQAHGNTHQYIQPDTLLVYAHDTWSVFGTIAGSGYSYDYDSGALKNNAFSTYALKERVGLAKRLNQKCSLGVAFDALQSKRTVEIGSDSHTDYDCGFGGTIGLQLQLGIIGHMSVQYSTPIVLSYDGVCGDIPPELKVGMGIWVLEGLCIKGGCNWYLNQFAQQEQILTGKDCDYWTGFAVGGGIDYRVSIPVTIQLGGSFIHGGSTNTNQDPMNPVQNGLSGVCSVDYRIKDNLTLTGAFTATHYFDTSYETIDIARDEQTIRMAITYKPL